jgi:hypothetical protein
MAQTTFSGPIRSGTKEAGIAGGPNVGIVSLAQTGTIAQNGVGTVDLTFNLPANAQITSITPDVTIAYDSATTATLTAGTASGGTQYITSVNVKTGGRTVATYTAAQAAAMANITTNTTLVVSVTTVGATTAGAVRVTVHYIQN